MGKLKGRIVDEYDANAWDEIAACEYAEWCQEQEIKQVNFELQEIAHETD